MGEDERRWSIESAIEKMRWQRYQSQFESTCRVAINRFFLWRMCSKKDCRIFVLDRNDEIRG